ncbi:MAG: family 43 glycosylhydrolase, partial [Chloroflexi bacterium]|nr:family 43 glycosylhydrolase [Chloroflexota bacterium]
MIMHALKRRTGAVGRLPRVLVALLIALLVAFGPAAMQSRSLATQLQQASTYSNPIIPQTAPDPAIIKALDGYYYIVVSSDFWEGGSYHILPIFRSLDLVHWTFVADAFTARPDWTANDAGLWAPDLQYYNHKYYMYYAASGTKPLPRYGTSGGSAIGVATAPTPAGPWTDSGDSAGPGFTSGPLIPPRSCAFNTDPGCYYWTFDPAEFTDDTGQKYLYFGSFFGGTLVQKLMPDGLHRTSDPAIQIGHWDRYEGTYVIRHDVNGQRYYYNFSAAANCCSGPNTGYSVEVNRATSPTGTFVDQNGFPMLYPGSLPAPTTRPVDDPAGDNVGGQGGGYPTLKQNGNKWQGTGHNALIADLSGHLWIVYHGVDKSHGWVDGAPFPVTFRQGLLDRIDWTADGWPVVNGGAGPSEVNTAPVTTPLFGDNFNGTSPCAAPETGPGFPGGWRVVSGNWTENPGACATGGFAEQTSTSGQALMVSQTAVPAGTRTECDLRLVSGGRYGCVVSFRQNGKAQASSEYIAAFLDPTLNALVTGLYHDGRPLTYEQRTPLPAGFDHTDWHHLTIDLDVSQPGRPTVQFTVSDRNRDPLAVQRRSFPADFGNHTGSVGLITESAHADFDNITTATLSPDVVPAPQTPPTGALLPQFSDEFNGTLGPQWSWIREDPSRHGFVGGQLS